MLRVFQLPGRLIDVVKNPVGASPEPPPPDYLRLLLIFWRSSDGFCSVRRVFNRVGERNWQVGGFAIFVWRVYFEPLVDLMGLYYLHLL